MKSYLLLLTLCGCMASNSLQYDAVATNNQYRLARLQRGMDEKEVLSIMHKPYSYESFVVGEDIYDVWFYVTRTTVLDQTRMVPQNLTPLTFKNGVLVSTGYSWYYAAMKEQALEMHQRCRPEPKPPTQAELDKEFEKNIREPISPSKGEGSVSQAPLAQPKAPVNGEVAAIIPATPVASVQKKVFTQVHIGMTEEEVTNLVGTPDAQTAYRIRGDIYDIWFYDVVTGFGSTKRVPLVFKNSVLVGTGDKYHEKVKQMAQPVGPGGLDRQSDQMLDNADDQNFNFW